MAKKKIDNASLIHFELGRLEDKIKEFQDYLQINSILYKKNGFRIDDDDNLSNELDKLHKEIVIQIKMQDALFNWMPLLEKLREKEENKNPDNRGDAEISNMFR